MSRKKKRSKEVPLPVGSAGLLSFYKEKTDSRIKIGPEIIIILTVTLIVVIILASVFFPL